MLSYDSDWWEPSDLLFATLPVGAHPAVVVEVSEKSLKVACCTSEMYPYLGADNFIPLPEGEGGIDHDSYVGCLELFELTFESLESDEKAFYLGAIQDETFNSITDRMRENQVL